jgi:hypothetical protein
LEHDLFRKPAFTFRDHARGRAMKFLSTFQTADFLDTLVSLAAAFVLAT